MAIVKCENTKCKYYDDGFYCKKLIVEMTDGMCDYWAEQKKNIEEEQIKKISKYFEDILLTKDQKELFEMIENLGDANIQYFNPDGTRIYDDICEEPLQYHDDINDLD